MSMDSLLQDMRHEHTNWIRSTRLYGTLYPLIRIFLIVASGIVAAKAALDPVGLASLGRMIPLLAVSVTVVTAIDTWLRPRDRWRGFMKDRDDLADLILKASSFDVSETSAFQKLREDFAALRRRHREENVY